MMFLKALPQNWYLSLFTYIHCPKQVISPCPVAMDGVGFSAESERQFRDSWQRAWMHDSFKGGSGVLGKIILCTVLKFWSLGQLRNLLNSTHQWMFETGVCYLSYVTEMSTKNVWFPFQGVMFLLGSRYLTGNTLSGLFCIQVQSCDYFSPMEYEWQYVSLLLWCARMCFPLPLARSKRFWDSRGGWSY